MKNIAARCCFPPMPRPQSLPIWWAKTFSAASRSSARIRAPSAPFAASYKTSRPARFSLGGRRPDDFCRIRSHALLGHYEIDDEGVPAQRVSLVEKGNLVNYVMGREPIRDFPASNGHGRARVPTNPPGPSLGNLIVTFRLSRVSAHASGAPYPNARSLSPSRTWFRSAWEQTSEPASAKRRRPESGGRV